MRDFLCILRIQSKSCISSASTIEELIKIMKQINFKSISITPKEFTTEWASEHRVEEYIVSAIIQVEEKEAARSDTVRENFWSCVVADNLDK